MNDWNLLYCQYGNKHPRHAAFWTRPFISGWYKLKIWDSLVQCFFLHEIINSVWFSKWIVGFRWKRPLMKHWTCGKNWGVGCMLHIITVFLYQLAVPLYKYLLKFYSCSPQWLFCCGLTVTVRWHHSQVFRWFDSLVFVKDSFKHSPWEKSHERGAWALSTFGTSLHVFCQRRKRFYKDHEGAHTQIKSCNPPPCYLMLWGKWLGDWSLSMTLL